MTGTSDNNLSKEKIQRLLVAVGSQNTDDSEPVEAVEYNWNQPHYFGTPQLKKLEEFSARTASTLAHHFTALCHTDFNVTIDSTTQQFADEFFKQVYASEQKDYYLALSVEQGLPCGLIGLSAKTATTWATQLLGDTGTEEEPDRELSQLEESLLLDVICVAIKAFSESHGSYDFQPAKTLVREYLPFEPPGTEPLCKINFTVTGVESENSSEAYFIIPCAMLEPVVGKNILYDGKYSDEEISNAIIEHLHKAELCVTAQVGSTILALKQTMDLQTGDILLLGKNIDEPIELIVEGQKFLLGRLAKSGGKYAVVITERLCQTE